MPTQPEVLAIEEAHRAAQARLGIAGAYLATLDWGSVSTTAMAATSDAWLSRNLQMIRAIQRKSSRLAQAYYQVARALETGHTLGLPEASSDPGQVTMEVLRQRYLDVLLEVADLGKPATGGAAHKPSSDFDERRFEEELLHAAGEVAGTGPSTIDFAAVDLDPYIQDFLDEWDATKDHDHIGVDDFTWPEETADDISLRDLFAEEIKAYQDEQAKKARKLQESQDLSAKEAAGKLQLIHDNTGTVNAGKVDEAGIQSGRNLLEHARSFDRRVLMVARATGPHPCAFCSMLASRGFVYLSKNRATVRKSDGQSYHPNCHCYPVFRWADIPDPTAPGRSDHYAQLWDTEIRKKGYERRGTKNDALNAWRRLMNAERRAELDAQRAAVRKSKSMIPGG